MIKAAITIMRDTVIVIIWWTAKPAKRKINTREKRIRFVEDIVWLLLPTAQSHALHSSALC